VTDLQPAVTPHPHANEPGRHRRGDDPQHAGGGAAAAEPHAIGHGEAGGDGARGRALDQGGQRDGDHAGVHEAVAADVDAEAHEEDREQTEDQAVHDRPPAAASERSFVEPADEVGVADHAEADRPGRLDHVVVVHGG